MQRRKLLKSLIALPTAVLTYNGNDVGRRMEVIEGRYIVFIDERKIDLETFCEAQEGVRPALPSGTPVYSVRGDIDKAIRIFKIE